MKFYITLFIAGSIVFSSCNASRKIADSNESNTPTLADNSRNSVDWDGVYRGVLPCADCEGIQTEIILNQDLTYILKTKYLSKGDSVYQEKGSFTWNEEGSKISLGGLSDPNQANSYLVGENRLFRLDAAGNRIEGALREAYILEKQEIRSIEDKYWALVSLKGEKVVKSENQEREAHFILDSKARRISGNGGCNIFNGSYYLEEGNKLSFSPLATTRMACFGVENEDQFFRSLEQVKGFSVDGDNLVLYNAGKVEVMRLGYRYFE